MWIQPKTLKLGVVNPATVVQTSDIPQPVVGGFSQRELSSEVELFVYVAIRLSTIVTISKQVITFFDL